MFRNSLVPGATSAAFQRSQTTRERFSLIEDTMAGCPKCGDPTLLVVNGYVGDHFRVEVGSGWTLDVFSNSNGRRELRAFPSRSGVWRRHECGGAS